MDDEQFRLLLDYLGYSWNGYRKVRKGVKKRVRRHMQRLGCRHISSYLDQLAQGNEIRRECEMLMTVSISRFFRDRHMWQMLENRWLPDIVVVNPQELCIWSAGCACGEEVYSFKIIWEHLSRHFDFLPILHIFASDRNPQHLKRARRGNYSRSSLREVPEEDLTAYFQSRKGGRSFAVKPDLKGGITWEIQNLLNRPPDRKFPIIFLRNNILTYCRQELQLRALKHVFDHLEPRGLLIIGCHERLPPEASGLAPLNDCPFVYRKR